MIIHQYKCRLLSEVIISSDTASEGQKKTLSYLPGVKFLGIVSNKLYKESAIQETLDLFHNGTVSFGDAHPCLGESYSLHTPFAWFSPKGGKVEEAAYVHHDLSEDKRKALLGNSIQLKQVRSGYFAPTGEYLPAIPQDFSIKSAYDRERRRAKDEQMYGYFSLPKGSEWLFTVEDRSGQYGEAIKKALEGKHRIGRSRSAEYGLVEIEFDPEFVAEATEQSLASRLVCYAESDWLFYDEYGQTTLQPDPIVHFGLPAGTVVDWSKSQIRSRLYQSWNSKRYNRDADRYIIEKGSVMIFHTPNPITPSTPMRVGAQQAQGFGRVRVNPEFLKGDDDGKSTLILEKIEDKNWLGHHTARFSPVSNGEKDGLVLQHLRNKSEAAKAVMSIDDLVNKFIKDEGGRFKGISDSQWGMVRNYAKHAANLGAFKSLIFEEGSGCLTKGQREADWRKQKRREILENFLFNNKEKMPEKYIIPFTIKLAAEMAKRKKKSHE